MERIIGLIKQDLVRIKALDCVYQLGLPQCYIAAGFVRNLVWDSLHGFETPTPLNDVDVIYFDQNEPDVDTYLAYESQLIKSMPDLNWQVRNQANMHRSNGHPPYKSSLDAMSHWPEKETAVGIWQISMDHFECISAFGFESLFNYEITYNSKSSREKFEGRINSKSWLVKWPSLRKVPW